MVRIAPAPGKYLRCGCQERMWCGPVGTGLFKGIGERRWLGPLGCDLYSGGWAFASSSEPVLQGMMPPAGRDLWGQVNGQPRRAWDSV